MRLGVIILACLLGIAAAELEFYRDVEPKFASAESLKRLARFLEAKSHSGLLYHQPLHHHQQPLQQQEQHEQLEELQLLRRKQQQHQQHLLELALLKQRGLLRDELPERPNIIDMLQRQAADPLEYVRELERQRLLPYLEYEAPPRIKPYSVEDETRARLLSSHVNKDPMLDYPETHYVDLERARQPENARRIKEAYRNRPEFTYAFSKPEPEDENTSPPFAVGPNDPRYYKDEPFVKESSEEEAPKEKPRIWETHHHEHVHEEMKAEKPSTAKSPTKETLEFRSGGGEVVENPFPKTRFVEVSVLPEPQRRAEQDPPVVTISHKVNNDVYFIAIVAGCSAVAMFALVLISLTWCRLQRVSKAAADVDYPAYGVTGPNKDISPSGDQRLAQSAQMYHFQHQKQQIIAMENRASATRDPGSVSDAESDEENEEGDYTVYECPGLAPTGEMEVKNPLFHDDPTPASPSKSSKKDSEDRDV